MRLPPALLVVLGCSVASGQQRKPPVVVTPPPVVLPKPFDIMDWTPRPAVGKAEPWEQKKDPDWDESRFQQTDTGPSFNATFR